MIELWSKTEKQKEMGRTIDAHKYTLCIGQGRSGKTLLILIEMFRNAIQYPNVNQAIFRNTLSSAVDGVWKITIKEVIEHFFPTLPMTPGFKMNESNHSITFPNGSRIIIKGLDNPERAQKLLSTQFMCVFFDECHLISYEHFGLLMTRMPQPLNVDYQVKIICAANWSPKTHWLKKFFQDGVNPENNSQHGQSTAMITSETSDNTTIDAAEYIETLNMAGDRRSRLACAGSGFYNEALGALWEQSDIKRASVEEYEEVVLAFDPAVTNKKTSDEHGICIAGKKDDKYYVISCFEKKEDINSIAKEVCQLYHDYECSRLIYETNQGADWVEALIRNNDSMVFCEGVRAKKGKIIRAEPIAALYKNELVYHEKCFQELEEQMVTYTGSGDSPNSLDALVYAIQYLSTGEKWVDIDDI